MMTVSICRCRRSESQATLLSQGSGTVTILETYRALLAANFTPMHDVEWHFYSAVSGFEK